MPPGGLVAAMMKLAMVGSAERAGEFVADLSRLRSGLCKANVMSVRGCNAAQQARLRCDKAQMILVADPPGLWKGEGALFDALVNDAHTLDWRRRCRALEV